MIDIRGFNKAKVLAALYNASHPQGMGFLHFDPKDMTESEAQRIIDSCTVIDNRPYLYFDYLMGRVMKVDLSRDFFDERLYDRDNGSGAAFEAVRNS
jgi:hypothetical protein